MLSIVLLAANAIVLPITILAILRLRTERRLQSALLDEAMTAIALFRIHRGR